MRNNMLRSSTLSFDGSSGNASFTPTVLPDDLKVLVPSDAMGVETKQSQDGSGKIEYKISFEIPQNMHDYYYNFRKILAAQGWAYLLGARSDLVNVIEFENSSYTLRSEITFVTSEKVTKDNMERLSTQTKQSQITISVKTK